MKAVIQRVTNASVTVNQNTIAKIDNGLFILLGVFSADTKADAEVLAKKVANLRIFSDSEDKMNLSLLDINASALVVSQFTLCADTKKGNRPSFSSAMQPEAANTLYEYFIKQLNLNGVKNIKHGCFGADMLCSINNDGPVTIILDTEVWRNGNV